MKRLKLTFWIIGFGCGMVVSGIIGAVLTINVHNSYEIETSNQIIGKTAQDKNEIEESNQVASTPDVPEVNDNEANKEDAHQKELELEPSDKKSEEVTSEETLFNQIQTTKAQYSKVNIPKNITAKQICALLEENKIVASGDDFLAYINSKKKQCYLRNGEFSLPILGDYDEILNELII